MTEVEYTLRTAEQAEASKVDAFVDAAFGHYVERIGMLFFFFQAEDGIRDGHVTRVQTCALPICPEVRWIGRRHGRRQHRRWASSWSPEQIANRLPVDFPDDDSMRISHEAIYQALYVQGRGALRRELTACLRTGRALRVP